VIRRLRTLDEVAYVRFASVYRAFRDASEFMAELEGLRETAGRERPVNAPEPEPDDRAGVRPRARGGQPGGDGA